MPYITEYVYTRPSRSHRSRALIWTSLFAGLAAIGLMVLPFWPRASYDVQTALPNHRAVVAQAETQAVVQPPGPGNWLLIPELGVATPVVEGQDIGVLDHETGVWHQTGQPGQGNLVIAGHRFKYLPPNQTTFYNLDRLEAGDNITLWWNGQHRVYRVVRSFTVSRDATEILNPTPDEQLTLYTCTDLAASHRLVVIAQPLGV
jgi:LPXTG-site transpeptidase (sortase) family protein